MACAEVTKDGLFSVGEMECMVSNFHLMLGYIKPASFVYSLVFLLHDG